MTDLVFPFTVELKPNDQSCRIDLPRVPFRQKWMKLELTCEDKPSEDFWLTLYVNNASQNSCTALGVFTGVDRRFYYMVEILAGVEAYFEAKPTSIIGNPVVVRFRLKAEVSQS